MLREEVPCYILAGGKSTRFGEDKLLYKINGERVIERVINTAKRVFNEVYVVAKDKEKFSFLNVQIIEDEKKEQASIIGLYTAIKHARGDKCFILSGDIPLISEETLYFILENYEPPVTIARTGEKIHTLVGVYSKSVLKTLKEFIEKKEYKINKFLKQIGYKGVDLPTHLEKSVINLNRKEDLDKVIMHIK